MTESEARKLEVPIEWNGKANVCTYCGRVPETFYVITGHDHTDDDIKWCVCREGTQYKSEIETLRLSLNDVEKIAAQRQKAAIEMAQQIESLRSRVVELGKEAIAMRQSLIGWRQRAWPGIDQTAVIDRDFPATAKLVAMKESK